MKRILFIIFTVLFACSSAQEYRKKIDSINQMNWRKTEFNLDSLSNPKIVDFNTTFKDTIIIRDEVVIPNVTEEIPMTPFLLNNYSQSQRWYFFGQNNLIFNQASFSNWNSGGNNNIGAIGKINYNLSYRNNKHYFENLLQLSFGLNASSGQASRKTEDVINFMTNYGYDLGKNYYLSTGFQFISQFAPGYNYNATPDPEFADRISRFMAPGYLNAGIGFSYNPNENFQVIFRPANGKFTFVTDPVLQKAGKYGLERDGQAIRTELGAMLNFIYRLKIYKNMHLDNQLNFFSNYISHPERVDIAYTGTLNIRFNKFISTVVSLDLVYDHDQIQKLQRKQTLGVGFSYNLGAEQKDKESRKKVFKPFISK